MLIPETKEIPNNFLKFLIVSSEFLNLITYYYYCYVLVCKHMLILSLKPKITFADIKKKPFEYSSVNLSTHFELIN